MSEVANKLRDQRASVWEAAKAIADGAAEESRSLTGEEQAAWDKANADLDALDARMNQILDAEKRARETEALFTEVRGAVASTNPVEKRAVDATAELRAFARGERGRVMEIGNAAELRDLVKGTATAGGNTVPTSFYGQLMQHLIEVAGIMKTRPTVLNTDSGENLEIPKTTAHGSAAIVGEGVAIAEGDPTFGKITLSAFKYGTLIQISRELLTDTGVDLQGYLAMQAGRALGNAFGAHAITGTGTTMPRGVVTDASAGVTGENTAAGAPAGTAPVVGAPTADKLIDLYHSVIEPYRASRSCAWLMRDATVASVRKLKDGQGQYLWQPSLQVGDPNTLLGKPVYTDPTVAGIAGGAKSVVFGDFSTYFVRLVNGIRFERSDDFAFDRDTVTFRALLRADAALVDLTGAVKVFTGGAS